MENLNHFPIEWGVATSTAPGQSASGDRHAVKAFKNGALVSVIDGLGHGSEAAEAAEVAARTLEEHAGEPVIALLDRCHNRLRPTRGVVMAVACIDTREGTLTWLGVGNVQGVLVRADAATRPRREFLLLRAGVVGGKFDRPPASIVRILPGDALIFFTDGLKHALEVSGEAALSLTARAKDAAEQLLARYTKGTDDALVLVARYRGSLP